MTIRDLWQALRQPNPPPPAAPAVEHKASAAGRVIVLERDGQPVWTPRDYAQLAREGYQRNAVFYRAVNEVARSAASVPWKLMDGENEIDAHPLLDLLRKPNPLMGKAEFIEAVLGYLMIAGNSYIEGAPDDTTQPPAELWPLRPDRMTVVPSAGTSLPQAYVYEVGGRKQTWRADPDTGASAILHIKTFHPLDDFYGMSPIEAAATAIDQHNGYGAWNMSLLQRGARPSGAMVYAPKNGGPDVLTDTQFAQLKSEIDEQYTGAGNAGRPFVLDGGLDWKPMSLTPNDMDFLNGQHVSARTIAQAVGVPSQLLGIPGDNTYSNYREARLALWEETVIPLLRHLRDELNGWLVPKFGTGRAGRAGRTGRTGRGGLTLDIDLDQVPALALRRETTFTMLQGADFLTPNEKREMVGREPKPNGDDLLVSALMVPLGGAPADEDTEPMTGDKAELLGQLAYGDNVTPLR